MRCKDTKSEVNKLKSRIAELEEKAKQPVITFWGFARFMIFLGSIALAAANTWFVFWALDYLKVSLIASKFQFQFMLMVPPMFVEYFVVFGVAFAGVAWIKHGWENLKTDGGLLGGLLFGLLGGLLGGLLFGLLVGLLFGLLGGLLVGLLFGLSDEFELFKVEWR